jgi:hypothetical protein
MVLLKNHEFHGINGKCYNFVPRFYWYKAGKVHYFHCKSTIGIYPNLKNLKTAIL